MSNNRSVTSSWRTSSLNAWRLLHKPNCRLLAIGPKVYLYWP